MSSKINAAPSMSSKERDWQAEEDCHTLVRAAEIKRDPKRYARAKIEAKRRLQQLKDVTSSK